MRIVEINVTTGKEKTLISRVPAAKADDLRVYYIGRLYATNRYNDYVIDVRPDGEKEL